HLPFTWNGVTLHAAGATALRVAITPTGSSVAITATDPAGQLVATIDELSLRPLPVAPSTPVRSNHLYALVWQALPAPSTATPDGEYAVLTEHHPDLADMLADALPAGTRAYDALADLIENCGDGPPPSVIVAPCPSGPSDGRDDELVGLAHATTRQVLGLIQRYLAEDRLSSSRLVLLTTGSAAVAGPGKVDLAQSPLWGLVRSVQAEHPDRVTLVDLDDRPAGRNALGSALGSALVQAEPQLMVRDGVVHGARLTRAVSAQGGMLTMPAGGNWRLAVSEGGTLEDLVLAPATHPDEALDGEQIRISVRAVGVNFRDVLYALGMI
ncbi:SpnB-like Rossmann fold domain-containing protein, partial [Actinomadura sp. LOL_011]